MTAAFERSMTAVFERSVTAVFETGGAVLDHDRPISALIERRYSGGGGTT